MSTSESSPKSFEGAASKAYSEKITDERVRDFCRAVGAEQSDFAPPTFLTLFRAGEFELFDRMGIALTNVLHGEQVYSYDSDPVRSGEEVTFTTTLSSVLEKKGGSGRMLFLVFETKFGISAPKPRHVGSSKTTIIVRESKQEKGTA